MFVKILLPTDFSPSSEAAMRLAREHFPEAERCLLHVLDPKRIANELASPVSSKDERDAMEREILEQLRAVARPDEAAVVRVGTAVETILAQAEGWGADLIVMGTHGRTGVAHFMNGSVAERVVRLARGPVLITHENRP